MTEAHAGAVREVLIAPARGWRALELGEIWAHRDLIYFLTKRELQIRYKQSFFGVSWAVLQPVLLAFVFALLARVVSIPTEGFPKAVFMVVGVVPWLFTAQAVQNSALSLVQDANLISKVYFPRLALPLSKALSLLIDLVISFAVVIVIILAYGVSISSNVWALPLFVLLGIVTTFSLGALLAAINVRYRDVQLVVPILIQVLFFLTPVIYPASAFTQQFPKIWDYIYAINPMVAVLDGIRWSLLGAPYPGDAVIAIGVGTALLLLAVALSYFQRAEQFFADVI